LKAWLKEHPQVEVIARDRWTAYARAVDEAAPQAKQVADRWHLLKNLREAVERFLARHAAHIPGPVPAQTSPAASRDADAVHEPVPVSVPSPDTAAPEPPPTEREQVRTAKVQVRQDRHRQVRDLHAQGHSLGWIAQHLGMSFRTVQRYPKLRAADLKPFHVTAWLDANPSWSGGQRHAVTLQPPSTARRVRGTHLNFSARRVICL
jgi:hypothetical protein